MSESCDIAVIGAGPAGLAAASLAASRGARTILLDEQPQPGGQIYRGIEALERNDPVLLQLLGADYGRGAVRFGLEANYSFVPNTIGLGGVSAVYGEKDVGGFAILGRLVFGTAR